MNRYALPALVLLGLVVRVPFWIEALRTPPDGDTAIIGLMARHPLSSTTMWGQPYGSPVEAWLVSPVLAVFGFTPAALRLSYFLLGLALIPAVAWLARLLDARAMLPAALLMACPSPYFLLLAAMPPPLYPTVLMMSVLLLALTIRIGAALEDGHSVPAVQRVAWGVLAGLQVWTHFMALTVVVPCALFLWRRARLRAFGAPALLAVAISSSPLLWRVLADPATLRIISPASRSEGTAAHLRDVLPQIHRPVAGLLGAHVPWLADDPDHIVYAPRGVAFGLVALQGMLLVAVMAGSVRGAPGLLLSVVLLTLLAFPFPARSSPSTIRFLTPAYVPLIVLVCWAAAVRGNLRRAVIVALALAAMNLAVGARLLHAWRGADRAEAPFHLPDLKPLQRELEARGIRRVYTSYVPAYRLTFESGERIVGTQPWNERFLHHALPYLDEVRFAHGVAWVLFPKLPTDLPPPSLFEARLGAAGGRWERMNVGAAVVFHAFVPPFDPAVTPLAAAGEAGDGRLETSVLMPEAGAPLTWRVDPPRPLSAITLVAPFQQHLPRGLDLEVSADGATFERVLRRRRREERDDLRWVNGHPQFVVDDDLLAVSLADRRVAAIRVTRVGPDAGAVGEVLCHAVDERDGPWEEWLDPGFDWRARLRALEEQPRRDRADWYYRRRLADRHR